MKEVLGKQEKETGNCLDNFWGCTSPAVIKRHYISHVPVRAARTKTPKKYHYSHLIILLCQLVPAAQLWLSEQLRKQIQPRHLYFSCEPLTWKNRCIWHSFPWGCWCSAKQMEWCAWHGSRQIMLCPWGLLYQIKISQQYHSLLKSFVQLSEMCLSHPSS